MSTGGGWAVTGGGPGGAGSGGTCAAGTTAPVAAVRPAGATGGGSWVGVVRLDPSGGLEIDISTETRSKVKRQLFVTRHGANCDEALAGQTEERGALDCD